MEPGHALGQAAHYIHLNPVRAKIVAAERLLDYPWSSLAAFTPQERGSADLLRQVARGVLGNGANGLSCQGDLWLRATPSLPQDTSAAPALRPYRRQLIAKRREGFSLRQIADALKAGPLACDVAPATLKGIIAGPGARRRAKAKKLATQRAAIMAAHRAAAGVIPVPVPTAAPATAAKK